MEQDDGFCGSCGAVLDADLTIDDGVGGPFNTAPDTAPLPPDSSAGPTADPDDTGGDAVSPTRASPSTSAARRAPLSGLDLGADFDERTDLSPSPLDDPPPPPVAVAEKPVNSFHAFLEENTDAMDRGRFEEESGPQRADRQKMVQPQVVLRCKSGVARAALSPFEQHVLSFLDGRRPLARLRKKAGLSFSDLKVAIGMLADRGVVEVVGNFVPDLAGLLEEDELAGSGPHGVPPTTAAELTPQRPRHPSAPSRVATSPATVGTSSATETPSARPSVPRARTGTPSGLRGPAAPAAPAPVAAATPAIDPKRAQANQLLERALAELRAGKRPAAIALVRMAAELVPGDPRIMATLKSLLG